MNLRIRTQLLEMSLLLIKTIYYVFRYPHLTWLVMIDRAAYCHWCHKPVSTFIAVSPKNHTAFYHWYACLDCMKSDKLKDYKRK